MLCEKCHTRKPIIWLRDQKIHLCLECLEQYILDNIRRELNKENVYGKHILIASSGGKDSQVLTYTLNLLKNEYNYELTVVTIDEGISNYSIEKIKYVKELCDKLNITLLTYRLSDYYHITIDKVAELYLARKIPYKPCTICGVFKRQLINILAREIGADYIATGHNLDDEAQGIIMNIIRGDFNTIIREYESKTRKSTLLVQRIKPLRNIKEKTIATYILAKKLPYYKPKCPHVKYSLRNTLRRILNALEEIYPGIKRQILELKELTPKIILEKTKVKPRYNYCKICGEPSASNLCRACQLKQVISKIISKTDLTKTDIKIKEKWRE